MVFTLLFCSYSQSQFYFGRNKIQYEQFDWQVLSTEHFDIYYYSEEESLAQAAANIAEDTFRALEIKFNSTLGNKVPLVIYSNHIHFQQTNILPIYLPEGIGGFFEYIKGRVVIPFPGNMAGFQHVIRHELVHVFTNAKIRDNTRVCGKMDIRRPPLWFIDGLAEWWSRGWDSQAEMVIRDALLFNHLYPLKNLGGFLVYKEGQSFLRYFEQHYGQAHIRNLMEEFCAYDSFEEALSAISGMEYEDLMKDWESTLKQEAAQALILEEIPTAGELNITRDGINVSPALYRDNKNNLHVAYLSNREGFTNIYSSPVSYARNKVVLKGERTGELESLHLLQSSIDVNTDQILTFVAKSGDQDVIKLLDLETEKFMGEFSHSTIVTIRSPKWSPDGKTIVFSAYDFEGQSDIYLWDVDKKNATRLTNDIYADQDPCFSPGGDWIVFSSDRGKANYDRQMDLFAIEIVTGSIYFLIKDSFNNVKPQWSVNSPEKIYFISDRSGTPNLWSLQITDSSLPVRSPVFVSQHTRLHTGIIEAIPTSGDSLLVNVFKEFSFQLQHIPSLPVDSLTTLPVYFRPNNLAWSISDDNVNTLKKNKQPYRLKYSLDIAQTAVAFDPIFGFLGGTQISISDLLGNHYYHFLLVNTAQELGDFWNRFNGAITYVNLSSRLNWGLNAFHFANDYFDPFKDFYFGRSIGVRASLNYPFNVFKRMEISASFSYSTRDYYFSDEFRKVFLVSNYFSLIHDNAIWSPIGPVDGWRARITIGPTFDFKRSFLHNITGLIDFRYYHRPIARVTLAQRLMVWYNDGQDLLRYFIGGSWGLRGYGFTQIFGSKAVMINNEVRFLFARSLALNFNKMAIGFAPIEGALFFDVGNAWDTKFTNLIGSFGFGLRGLLMQGLVIRLDVGKTTDFKTISNKWFTKLFFGWDY